VGFTGYRDIWISWTGWVCEFCPLDGAGEPCQRGVCGGAGDPCRLEWAGDLSRLEGVGDPSRLEGAGAPWLTEWATCVGKACRTGCWPRLPDETIAPRALKIEVWCDDIWVRHLIHLSD
jgi:hypothetical protein